MLVINKYILVSLISIIANIALQILFLEVYTKMYRVELSIIIATALTMPARYVLERKFIFSRIRYSSDTKSFLVYTFSACIATVIFIVTEYVFHLVFANDALRYLGGMIGLSLGFYFKFWFDTLKVYEGK
tara:strand:- start:5206 stop:5595 length:390 start_codon:yes stop_codon:yes gene_type:complete